MRVRGRARDVGDAEPHHGAAARAQAAKPVPAAAAAVGRQVPPLPGLLVDQDRRRVSSAPALLPPANRPFLGLALSRRAAS